MQSQTFAYDATSGITPAIFNLQVWHHNQKGTGLSELYLTITDRSAIQCHLKGSHVRLILINRYAGASRIIATGNHEVTSIHQ